MQVQALMEALIESEKEGMDVKLEIMLPLVSHVNEFTRLKGMLEPVSKETLKGHVPKTPIKWGTMIEIPRACLTAEKIAEHAEFFSFGTK
jgi:pyruvate,orthophosphate dikinase